MKLFFKPDDVESDDESDFELTNQDNEPVLLGFDVGGDLVQGDRIALESDDSYEFGSDEEYEDDEEESDQEVPETMSEGTDEDNATANTSKAAAAGTRGAGTNRSDDNNEAGDDDDDDDDDEEDDVIQRILANSKTPKSHPPDISIDDYVVDLSFHPTNDLLAAGTMTGDVIVYRYAVEECEVMSTIEIHSKAIRSIEFDGDGEQIYSASKDRSVLITNVETGKFVREYAQAHDQAISKLHILDEHMFATGDDDGTVKVWDTRDRAQTAIFALKEVDDYITQLLTNNAAKVLLATSGDGYLTAISIGSRKLMVQSEPYDEELTCMGLFRNDSKLVVGTSKGRQYTFNWHEFGYHNSMYPGSKAPMSHMIPVTDRVGVVAGEDGVLRALHCIPGRNLGVVGQHCLAVDAMDINHDGQYIASTADNNEIKFWNVKYFEDLDDIKYNEKHNKTKDTRNNLPSSKVANAGDFFSDLV